MKILSILVLTAATATAQPFSLRDIGFVGSLTPSASIQIVSAPTFSPDGGSDGVAVTIATTTTGATVHASTNDFTTEVTGTTTVSLTPTQACTIKAYAVMAGYTQSTTNTSSAYTHSAVYFAETFEGTGFSNAGWYNYNGYTGNDPDATNVVLNGAQSYKTSPTDSHFNMSYRTSTIPSHVYGKYLFRPQQVSFALMGVVFSVMGVANYFDVHLDGYGKWVAINGTTSNQGTNVYSGGSTMYYVWFEYQKSTGSDGIAKVWVSTSNSQPSTPEASVTTGNGTATPELIGITAQAIDIGYFDDLQLSTSPIP